MVDSFSFHTHVVKRIPKCSYNLLSRLRRARSSPSMIDRRFGKICTGRGKKKPATIGEPLAVGILSRTQSHTLNKKKQHLRKRGECITLISAFINLNNNEPIFSRRPAGPEALWYLLTTRLERRWYDREKYIHTRWTLGSYFFCLFVCSAMAASDWERDNFCILVIPQSIHTSD